jgi:hypothetical protein
MKFMRTTGNYVKLHKGHPIFRGRTADQDIAVVLDDELNTPGAISIFLPDPEQTGFSLILPTTSIAS